ncbi:MAG: hypothetical protein SFY32_07220 [Bacteroidota bacterium]|nr:hypothetical protein [Bacteroidota bacterium]
MKTEKDITPAFILKIITLYLVLMAGYANKNNNLESFFNKYDTTKVANIHNESITKHGLKYMKNPISNSTKKGI